MLHACKLSIDNLARVQYDRAALAEYIHTLK